MGPIWDRQDPGGPHVGTVNFAMGPVEEALYWPLSLIGWDNGLVLLSHRQQAITSAKLSWVLWSRIRPQGCNEFIPVAILDVVWF